MTGPSSLTRRTFLGAGAATVGLALAGCSRDTTTTTATTTTGAGAGPAAATTTTAGTAGGAATVFTAADFAALGTCVAMPEQMAGPFPSPDLLDRRDVREDRVGAPLRVGAQVVDARCRPVAGARLEIWHCDVDGDYSAYLDGETDDDAGPGTAFLRGVQTTDADGIVEFVTIFPGWYTGRAVHIHARVHTADGVVLTSQWYFDQAVCDEVYATAPYRGPADTTNAADGIAADDPATDGTMLTVSDDAALRGRRALIRVGLPA